MSLRVCLVALNAYPALERSAPGVFGGIETRAWQFARGLAQIPECDVHFLVRTPQPLLSTSKDNVCLHRIADPSYAIRESLAVRYQRVPHFPFIKATQPKPEDLLHLPLFAARRIWRSFQQDRKLEQALETISADVYLTFGVQGTSRNVIEAAHHLKKPAAMFTGCDLDLDPRFLTDPQQCSISGDSAADALRMIQTADELLCQTPAQSSMALAFARQAKVIENPFDLQQWEERSTNELPAHLRANLERYALWVGRADGLLKRPQELLQLAVMTPEIPFLMILNRREDALEQQIRAQAPENLKIIESVPFELMPGLFQRAAVLVNTSIREGFPNTFLQAAASGVPVASLHVEEEFLSRTGIGSTASGNMDRLQQLVRTYWHSGPSDTERQQIRNTLLANHGLTEKCRELFSVLKHLKTAKQRTP